MQQHPANRVLTALTASILLTACGGADGGGIVGGSAPTVTVDASAGTLAPSFSWQPSGSAKSFRYLVDSANVGAAGQTTSASGARLPLSMGPHTLYVSQQVDGGWSTPGSVQLFVDSAPTGLCVGLGFACATDGGGALYCWGNNNAGQLGQGDVSGRGAAAGQVAALGAVALGGSVAAVRCGSAHVCATLADGSVRCWGNNKEGELGLGDSRSRGGAAADMGAALPALQLGGSASGVAVGASSGAAVMVDGSVGLWGTTLGAVGSPQLSPVASGLGGVVGLALGDHHACALGSAGTLSCWGSNDSYQLGMGDTTARPLSAAGIPDFGGGRKVLAVRAGGQQTCAILDDGSLMCVGQSAFPNVETRVGAALPTLDVGQGHYAIGMALGAEHTCILRDDSAVKCWGSNTYGQLGRPGPSTASGAGDDVPAVALGTGRYAVALAAGGYSTCARLDDGSVKCWGANAQGQLGVGDTVPRGLGSGDMGDALPAVPLP